MDNFPKPYPLDGVEEVFANIFEFRTTNEEKQFGLTFRFPRNMHVIKEGDDLTIVNSARLDDDELKELEKLGSVKNLVSIGCRHGKDDAFYIDRYKPKFWVTKNMKYRCNKKPDVELTPGGEMPFSDCDICILKTVKNSEGILIINREGGILLTCDAILANTQELGKQLKGVTAFLFKLSGVVSDLPPIPLTFRMDTKAKAEDYKPIKSINYIHLISAHGAAIKGDAKEKLEKSLQKTLKI